LGLGLGLGLGLVLDALQLAMQEAVAAQLDNSVHLVRVRATVLTA